MRVRLLGVVAAAAALVAACTWNDRPIHGTTTLPPGATIVIRPTPPPFPPSRQLGIVLGKYEMAEPLSARGPAAASTHDLGTPAQRRALDLARALGFGDAPFNFGNPWTVERGQAALRIWPEGGGRWEYGRQDADQSTEPDERRASRLARPILSAAGLDLADARHDHADVVVEPRLKNRPTWGWETRIRFDGKGVSHATGWLGPAKPGPERSLLDATQAFTRLQQQAAVPPTSGTLCPAAFQQQTPPCMRTNANPLVTGARFVYAVDWREGHHPNLVPAWQFTRQGTDELVTFPA